MLNNKKQFNKGILLGIGAVLCFSVITTFGVKVYQSGVSPLGLLTFRSLVAGFLVFLTILISKKISFRIEKKDWFRVFIHSFLLALFLILFWQGTKILTHIPTIYACYFTYPFWTMIIASIFLKEKFNKIKVVSLFLGIIGTFFALGFLPSLSLVNINLYGISLILLCAVIWGGDLLIGQQLFKKYHYLTILFYNFLISLIIFALFQNPVESFNEINLVALPYMIAIAFISTYLAWILFSNAIKCFGGVNWGLTNLLSPFANGLVAFLVLGQVVSYYQAFGITLSVCGVYILYKNK